MERRLSGVDFEAQARSLYFQNGRRPPFLIWSNRKWRRSIRRPRKTHPRTKHEGDRLTRWWDYGHLKFSKMCEWALRSVVGRWSVGRQYSYFLHWTYNARGVKI